MPHIVVKLWPGKSENQKQRLAGAITKDVMEILNYSEKSISVAMQEVKPEDWAAGVYRQTGGPEQPRPTLQKAGI